MKDIIEEINKLKLVQDEYYDEQEFNLNIDAYLEGCKVVAEGLDIDKHRWYETSITVYERNGEYFGIRYITNLYSEGSSYEDCYHQLTAFPMKKVETAVRELAK